MQCVHMPRVNLEGATLRGCSMDERLGVRTNLEGVFVCVLYCTNMLLCTLVMVDYLTRSAQGRSGKLHYDGQFKELRSPGPLSSVIPCHHSAVMTVLSKQYRFVDTLNHKLVIIRPLQEKCPSLSLLPRISLLSIF